MGLRRNDLTANEIALSQFLFAHYHSNPGKDGRSQLSDDLAANLRTEEDILGLANLLARQIKADFPGEVIGFIGSAPRPKSSLMDFLEQLVADIDPKTQATDPDGLDMFQANMDTLVIDGALNVLALWQKASIWLKKHGHPDAQFEPEFAEVQDDRFRPGIRADGLTIACVNTAIIHVLRDNSLDEAIPHMHQFMATHQGTGGDDGDWVFSRAGID